MKKFIFSALIAMASTGAMANEYCDSDEGAAAQETMDTAYSDTYMEENLMYSDDEEFQKYMNG